MAKLITTDGIDITVVPNNGKFFTYEEIKMVVGGLVQFVPLPDGREIAVNEEGKCNGLPENITASRFWQREYPIEKYPDNNDGLIVGNCLIGTPEELGFDQD